MSEQDDKFADRGTYEDTPRRALAEAIPAILIKHFGRIDYAAASEILDLIHEERMRMLEWCRDSTMKTLEKL